MEMGMSMKQKQKQDRKEFGTRRAAAFDSWPLSSEAVQHLPPVSLGNHIERQWMAILCNLADGWNVKTALEDEKR